MFETEVPLIIRHMIDDIGDEPTYSDSRLVELALIAALRLKAEVSFPNVYSVDVDSLTIAPDPTSPSTRDDNFISLLCLKAASLLAFSEAKTSSGQGITVRDGSSLLDLRGVAQTKFLLAKELEQQYQDAKLAYQAGNNVVGKAILGLFRIYYPIQPYDPLRPLY